MRRILVKQARAAVSQGMQFEQWMNEVCRVYGKRDECLLITCQEGATGSRVLGALVACKFELRERQRFWTGRVWFLLSLARNRARRPSRTQPIQPVIHPSYQPPYPVPERRLFRPVFLRRRLRPLSFHPLFAALVATNDNKIKGLCLALACSCQKGALYFCV